MTNLEPNRDGDHLKLLLGPAASGKTGFLLARAHEVLARRGRVLWIGLPQQRDAVYRRATLAGAVLGLEVLSSQQLYYRLLAAALKLKPLVIGTARIALVGEALLRLEEALPSPGEASLFAQAIAESKRYGLGPDDVPALDRESERFKRIFARYERLKGEGWDYDDFRSEALAFLERGGEVKLGVDLVVVDGFRELSPLELSVYEALAERLPLWLGLPEAPPGYEGRAEYSAALRLTAPARPHPPCYRAPNPVAEARWVLRSLKRDLASGMDPLELAVIVPEGKARAFAALADEYGVPLMDESPKALADTPGGRMLLDLIELPDGPTASKLLVLPELAPLAREALARGVAGHEALSRLAQELGVAAVWEAWLGRLLRSGDEEDWARELVNSLPAVADSPYREAFLLRAKEARSLARGADFRRWWAALLQATRVYDRPKGGVALLSAKLASGRRWRRVYLMHAVGGAYGAGEGEDYFVPEEGRRPASEVFGAGLSGAGVFGTETSGGAVLPRRFAGRDRLLFAELLSRGEEQVVSYPEADQAGPLLLEPALVLAASGLTPIPVGSRLELASSTRYTPATGPVRLGGAHVESLRHYERCAFRYWAERRLSLHGERPWWRALVSELREMQRLSEARLAALALRYPQAEAWLGEHAPRLRALAYGLRLPEAGAPQVLLDAAERGNGRVTLYHFVPPGQAGSPAAARVLVDGRWAEWWAAHYLLTRWGRQVSRVQITVWPLLGEPQDAVEGEITYVWKKLSSCERRVAEAHARFAQGEVSAKPGFICRDCAVKDLCREARP
jgi:hypothetical protein